MRRNVTVLVIPVYVYFNIEIVICMSKQKVSPQKLLIDLVRGDNLKRFSQKLPFTVNKIKKKFHLMTH